MKKKYDLKHDVWRNLSKMNNALNFVREYEKFWKNQVANEKKSQKSIFNEIVEKSTNFQISWSTQKDVKIKF